ncbi:MAG: PIN domain-containing protein [Mycobacteriales bacterium]
MSFIVVYDANVLYPSTLRDLLIRIAQAGLVGAKWTDEILDEVFDNLRGNRPDLNPAALDRTRELMVRAVRDCLVVDYQPLVDAIQLPDPKDRHVLAAAIKSRAQVIVTTNLEDFPAHRLDGWNVEAKHPDEFVLDQIDLDRQAVYGAVQRIADAWRNPPGTILDVFDRLERDGLAEPLDLVVVCEQHVGASDSGRCDVYRINCLEPVVDPETAGVGDDDSGDVDLLDTAATHGLLGPLRTLLGPGVVPAAENLDRHQDTRDDLQLAAIGGGEPLSKIGRVGTFPDRAVIQDCASRYGRRNGSTKTHLPAVALEVLSWVKPAGQLRHGTHEAAERRQVVVLG